MVVMKRLSNSQQSPLFELIEFQKDPDRHKEFEFVGDKVFEPPVFHSSTPITQVKRSTVYLWHQLGLIQLVEGTRPTFELRVEAFDHYRRVKTWWLLRETLNVFDTWKGDLKTAVIAMGTSIITSVITAFVLKWLGLL